MKTKSTSPLGTSLALLLGALLAFSGAAWAQAPTGNVYGTVTDASGSPLPGVTVLISGIGADRTQMTDERGNYRFLALDPGSYTIKAELDGFGAIEYPGVDVRVSRNTTVPLVLSTVSETITVTSETPLLDERKLQQGTTISQTELEKIPTARDPWAVLNQTPGVLVDRVNVGGNESGQQSSFRAAGVGGAENDFLVDGVSITDMRAIGASPTYYDFDQFAEMQFSTGGTDVTKNSSGVSVNLVTKRGSNEFRGSARFYGTKAGGYFGGALKQSQPNISSSDLAPGQSPLTGAQIREIEEVGFEAGGAVVRDKFWMWGSWGQNDIQQNAASGTADDTILENTSLKANAQFTAANSAVGSWNNGDKQKFGRGAGTTRPDITTWNQRGPSAVYRFEDTHVFSSNLFVTGTYSIGDFGFQLGAKGGVGPGAPESYQDQNGVWQDNYLSGSATSPNNEFKADSSYFFNTGETTHELKVGGRFRTFETSSAFIWPGRNIFTDATPLADGDVPNVVLVRGIATPVTQEYFSLWAQDTISLGRATINVGLRYDDQSGINEASTVPGNPAFPSIMPAIDFPGISKEFDWTTITPRLGFTYALGAERDTLIRASLAQFADQLQTADINRTNPASTAYAYFEFDPTLGSGKYNDEPLGAYVGGVNFDINNPTSLVGSNVTDPGLDAPMTTEFVGSIEHALVPEFVIGASVTARKVEDILDERSFIQLPDGTIRTERASDYVADGSVTGTLPDGQNYNVPIFSLAPGLSYSGGRFLTNGDRERNYLGVAVNFTKRLANQWMMRGYVNYGEAEWDVPQSFTDNSDPNLDGFVVHGADRAIRNDVDGETFVTRSTGSGKGERFLQSKWAANLTGMYQVAPDRPWGFNISTSLNAREGYPILYFDRVRGSDGTRRRISVINSVDDYRLDDLVTADIRLEKEFNLTGPVNMTFGIDVFNITNEGTELSRNRQLNITNANFLQDNVSPRIYRIGVRLGWK